MLLNIQDVTVQCNGLCGICAAPCYRGEVPRSQLQDFADPLPLSKKEINGAEKAFDAPIGTELAVIDNAGQFELKRNIFGKEKVRKVK